MRGIRLKIGRPGDTDVRACEAVRKRVGADVTMRLDANGYYRPAKEAIAARAAAAVATDYRDRGVCGDSMFDRTDGGAAVGIGGRGALGGGVRPCPADVRWVGPLRYRESIVQEPLRIEDGMFYVPEGPGLGITPDWDVIGRWRV